MAAKAVKYAVKAAVESKSRRNVVTGEATVKAIVRAKPETSKVAAES